MSAKGEVDIKKVRTQIKQVLQTDEGIDEAAKHYEEAYSGTGLNADEIWEEMICDSLGDMNIFSKSKTRAEAAEVMSTAIPAIQQAVSETKTEGGQETRGSPEGKASRENKDYLIHNFNGFIREGKEITLSNEIKARIASAIKSGNGILSKSRELGRVYVSGNKNFCIFRFNGDGSVTIVGIFDSDIDGEFISIVEEVIKNDGDRKRSGGDLSRYLERFRDGQGYTNNNIGSIASSLRSDVQTDAVYSRSSRDNSRRSGETGSTTNQNQITSHIPIKQSFVDVAGKRRNVLGIGNGRYMVQGTKKNNYQFNSIEDAISAENENIIKRYANNNDRSVTWVKNELLKDPNFLAKEQAKGKASRELDLDYDENIEATKTLTNRDILVGALESATTSQAERHRFTTKPTPTTKSLSRHRL